MILPEVLVPDVTTGHLAHHTQLHDESNHHALDIALGDGATETDIQEALADVHAAGAGKVTLTGSSYTASDAVAFNITLPTVSFDLGQATIFYTGSGICLRVKMNPFTVAKATGVVRGGHIDGGGAAAGAIGVQYGGIISGAVDGTVVTGFDGAGSVGWDFYNDDATWTERCSIRAEGRDCTIIYRFRVHASGYSSFLYNDLDLKFNVDVGQTALKTVSPAQLFDCFLRFKGNVDNEGTIFDLAAQSVVRPRCDITVEQTNGSGAVLFAGDDMAYPVGAFQANNFPDYGDGLVFPNYESRGVDVVFSPLLVSSWESPLHSMGLTVGGSSLGAYAAVYDGGVGADFALIKVPFGSPLSGGRVAAQLDSVTRAEIGFRPGSFTSGSRPAANAVPIGTMIFINDLSGGVPVWSDGTQWRNAAGVVT